jgi:RNA polymerase sigma-70 factor (ECF subfamily)
VSDLTPLPDPRRWSEDHALAVRCAGGDRTAQRLLYEREKRRVHAKLFRIFGSNRQIEDAIQEVFLQVFRSLASFRGESSLATWIDRCTVRVAFAELARRKGKPELELVQDVPSSAPTLDAAVHARDATRRLYAALDALESKQRVAFALHELEGRSVAEVAVEMEASVVATKTRIFRARLALEAAARKDAVLATFLADAPEQGEEP